MSNLKATCKVADQIVSRLFDHRHFISGEIDNVVQHMAPGTRLEDNLEKLLKVDQSLCLTDDLLHPDRSIGERLADASSAPMKQLGHLNELSNRLLQIEDQFKVKEELELRDVRAKREKTKQDMLKKLDNELQRLNDTLHKEEADLERKYLRFEENLRVNK